MNKRPAYAAQPRGLPPKLVAPPAVPHETSAPNLSDSSIALSFAMAPLDYCGIALVIFMISNDY